MNDCYGSVNKIKDWKNSEPNPKSNNIQNEKQNLGYEANPQEEDELFNPKSYDKSYFAFNLNIGTNKQIDEDSIIVPEKKINKKSQEISDPNIDSFQLIFEEKKKKKKKKNKDSKNL